MKKQRLAPVLVGLLATGVVMAAQADTGFYGGVSYRENGTESNGIVLGALPSAWNRFVAPVTDDTAQRTLAFGGYRWKNDVAVEAAFNTRDPYALRSGLAPLTGGVNFVSPDASPRVWNADVFTSWEFVRSVSLYGRLGYSQADARPLFTGASLIQGDPRRPRDGVNYGVGLRYDMTQALGLRVEYARFGRFAGEYAGGLPESDQVSIGVQFKF